MSNPFEFLDPLVDLENKIEELRRLSEETGVEMASEVESLTKKFEVKTRDLFSTLSAWQRVSLARHPLRDRE